MITEAPQDPCADCSETLFDPFQDLIIARNTWRRLSKWAIACIFLLVAAVVVAQWQYRSIVSGVKNSQQSIDQSLTILKDATGPEARARSAASINTLVLQIDCNNKKTVQDVLVQLGVPAQIDTSNCPVP